MFGEIYVGLERLGVIDALRALGDFSTFLYDKEHLIRVLVV